MGAVTAIIYYKKSNYKLCIALSASVIMVIQSRQISYGQFGVKWTQSLWKVKLFYTYQYYFGIISPKVYINMCVDNQ